MYPRDYVSLGPAPSNEDCVQVGDDDYGHRACAECERYIFLLRDIFGEEPGGAHFAIKKFPHDFGSSYEVVCYFNSGLPESVEYAYRVEREAPTTWGREADKDTNPYCPECGGILEPGNAFALSALMAGDGYLCRPCRLLFTHDLKVLAHFMG